MDSSLHIETCSAAKPWDDYVRAHPGGTLYHSACWRRIVADAFGKEAMGLQAVTGSGEVRGVLPLVHVNSRLLGNRLVSMPYANYGGVLADTPEVADALVHSADELARERGVDYLELRQLEGDLVEQDLTVPPAKVIMKLDLPDDIDGVGSQIGAKRRSQVRRPLKDGATVAHGGLELLPEFYAIFCRNMRDLGTPVYPRRIFETIFEHASDAAHIVLVRVDGTPAAAGFLLRWRANMEIPWASTNRDYNRLGVNMLLYWEALKLAIEMGCEVFDFGRSTPDTGTYRFKKQWGAGPVNCRWRVTGPAIPGTGDGGHAERLSRLWTRLPLAISNRVGPWISPDLPW